MAKLKRNSRVHCSVLSGNVKSNLRPLLRKPRKHDNANDGMAEVANYSGVISFVVNAAKKKGIRFVKDKFPNSEIECKNNGIAIFRGSAAKLIDRIFDGDEGGITVYDAGSGFS